MKIGTNRVNALILFIVFILLDFIYKNIIVKLFGYLGFSLMPFNIYRTISTYIIIVIIIYLINFKRNGFFSTIILQLITLFLIYPAIILFRKYANGYSDPYCPFAFLF